MRHLVVTPNRIARDFDRMFNGFFNVSNQEGDADDAFVPRVNIEETKDDVSLTFELPGVEKDSIKVMVKDDVLTVEGERKSNREVNDDDIVVRREIRLGKFSRSFTLPETVEPDSVGADYNSGLLVVKLDKKEEVKPRKIEVKIS
ncbi:MAG: Hsp20/alpha crystallin family protein [candidate division Zixibacteria bacterium]|nr:Hsp20/alpha crystallin family protein [candidate division Zixibacteria bacterium]